MGRTGPTARDRARARLLDRSIRARLSRFLRRALTSDGPSWEAVTFAGILVGAALAWSIVANAVHVPVLASLAPYDPGDAINTLWQVHSAVVALSIPLLVLLLEQAQSKAVLATTTGHVLMSDCSAVATTVVSLGSVIELGVVAVYLPSDGALLANLILSAICVVLITRGYWNALGLLASPFRLRDRSRAVLFSRVKASVEESFEHALANDEVELQLHAWRPTLYPPPERAGWLPVLQADRAGSVEDVLIEPLRRALTQRRGYPVLDPIHLNRRCSSCRSGLVSTAAIVSSRSRWSPETYRQLHSETSFGLGPPRGMKAPFDLS
jgi:hypothetical protein